MRKRRTRTAVWAALALASAAAAWLLSHVPFVHTVHLKASDLHFVLRGRVPVSDVVLITMDQKALDTFPELLMFWHPYYAEAIRAAAGAGAKVMALDIAFGIPVEKWEPDHDRMLVEAVNAALPTMPVVCGYVPAVMAKQRDWPVPLNIMASALGLSAYANLTVDSDDFVRNQELMEAPPPDRPPARSMALLVAEKYLGTEAELRDGIVHLRGRPVPASAPRSVTIHYAGPAGTVPRVSLADFIGAARNGRQAQLESWVKGKAVLMGPDSIDDRHATPYFGFLGGTRWNTAGVEIHANTVRTLIEGRYLVPVPGWFRALALLLASAGTAALIRWIPGASGLRWLVLIWLGVAAFTHLLFRSGWIVSSTELLISSVTCFLLTLAYRFSTAEKRRELFRRAVSVFVGKEVATGLEESGGIHRTGTRREVTIMFTDIRGFTAFCESQDPATVVDLLNEYLSARVKIIMEHKGHVNKFIGDGILAVFSDADDSESGDHASRAVRCAQAIVTYPDPQFRTGAGLHTGPVVVGNIGSMEKMEYTVLGDTVNLASRLEGMNKEHKTKLLISEQTRQRLSHDIEVVEIGSLAVRGKKEPVAVFTLKGLEPEGWLAVKKAPDTVQEVRP